LPQTALRPTRPQPLPPPPRRPPSAGQQASSLSELSTNHEQIGDFFRYFAVLHNKRIRRWPLATYSSAKLLTPTDCYKPPITAPTQQSNASSICLLPDVHLAASRS